MGLSKFLGLTSEWWSVIGTFITGGAAVFIGWRVYRYTSIKDHRLGLNYKIRIAWLLLDLKANLLISISYLSSGEEIHSLNHFCKDVINYCDKIIAYVDKILDQLEPKDLSGIENSLTWIKELYGDIKTIENKFYVHDHPNELVIYSLQDRIKELDKFRITLNINQYVKDYTDWLEVASKKDE